MTYRVCLAALALFVLPVSASAKSKLAVLPTQFDETSAGKVPKLFDDYLLTAVQNAGDFEVIGQDDISALLGFEKQKDLVGCDDMSCIADIGGALGVDRLVVVKIAHLQDEWISTAKLINIREARVEARSSDFVAGEVRDLLRAVPEIVRKLFAGGGSATVPPAVATVTQPTKAALGPSAAFVPPANVVLQPDPSLGRGARVTGGIFAGVGLAMTAVGVLYTMGNNTTSTCDYNYTTYASDCYDETDYAGLVLGSTMYTTGLVLTGIGSGLYMNGKARAATGDARAIGRHAMSWLAWVLVPIAAIGPLAFADTSSGLAWGSGLGGTAAAAWIFSMRMWSDSTYARTSTGARAPIAHVIHLRDSANHRTPAFALSWDL
ncbi:MAG: hypothetical protein AAB426_01055 [Myxococcota bacterium]